MDLTCPPKRRTTTTADLGEDAWSADETQDAVFPICVRQFPWQDQQRAALGAKGIFHDTRVFGIKDSGELLANFVTGLRQLIQGGFVTGIPVHYDDQLPIRSLNQVHGQSQSAPGARGIVEIDPYRCPPRLAALVPKPRVNLTRFHGVFAPNSQYRARVTPARRGRGGQPDTTAHGEERTPVERRPQ